MSSAVIVEWQPFYRLGHMIISDMLPHVMRTRSLDNHWNECWKHTRHMLDKSSRCDTSL